VRTGVLAARGELVVFTDADGSYGPRDIGRIVAALTAAPVAIGSRDAALAAGPLVRRLASLLFNRVIQTLLGLPFPDTQSSLRMATTMSEKSSASRAPIQPVTSPADDLVGLRASDRDRMLEVLKQGSRAATHLAGVATSLATQALILGTMGASRCNRSRS
jgi:hypothetical protein